MLSFFVFGIRVHTFFNQEVIPHLGNDGMIQVMTQFGRTAVNCHPHIARFPQTVFNLKNDYNNFQT